MREIIQDGETGLLFPPGDENALVALLTRLIEDNDLRKRLGERARSQVTVGASWTDRARALVSHINLRRHEQSISSSCSFG